MLASDLQQLSHTRLHEAQALLLAGFPAGAYYLAGYAVEAALKACIAKQTLLHEFPDRDRTRAAWQHDLESLLDAAGLKQAFRAACVADRLLEIHWTLVKDWMVESRYELSTSTRAAEEFLSAANDPEHGVLTWLKQRW